MTVQCPKRKCLPPNIPVSGLCCFPPDPPHITTTFRAQIYENPGVGVGCRDITFCDSVGCPPDGLWATSTARVTPQPDVPCFGPENVWLCGVPGTIPDGNGPYSGEVIMYYGACPDQPPLPPPPPPGPGPGGYGSLPPVQTRNPVRPLPWPRVSCERQIRLGY